MLMQIRRRSDNEEESTGSSSSDDDGEIVRYDAETGYAARDRKAGDGDGEESTKKKKKKAATYSSVLDIVDDEEEEKVAVHKKARAKKPKEKTDVERKQQKKKKKQTPKKQQSVDAKIPKKRKHKDDGDAAASEGGPAATKPRKYTPKAKRDVIWGQKLSSILSQNAEGTKPAAYSVERDGFTVIKRYSNGTEDYRKKFSKGNFVIFDEYALEEENHGAAAKDDVHDKLWRVELTYLDQVSKATSTRLRRVAVLENVKGVPSDVPMYIRERPTIVLTNRCKILKSVQQYRALALTQVATDPKDEDAVEKSRFVFLNDNYATVKVEWPTATTIDGKGSSDRRDESGDEGEYSWLESYTFLDQAALDESVDWIEYLAGNYYTTPPPNALFRHEPGWRATKGPGKGTKKTTKKPHAQKKNKHKHADADADDGKQAGAGDTDEGKIKRKRKHAEPAASLHDKEEKKKSRAPPETAKDEEEVTATKKSHKKSSHHHHADDDVKEPEIVAKERAPKKAKTAAADDKAPAVIKSISTFEELRKLVADVPNNTAPSWKQMIKINALTLKTTACVGDETLISKGR